MAHDGNNDEKILDAVHNYLSSLDKGDIESLIKNSVKSNRERMLPCLDDSKCYSGLRADILFVKTLNFKVLEIKDSVTPPGKIVTYSATRVFGDSKPASQQAGNGELIFTLENEKFKMASVSWNPH